jgi:hypothetical protein
MESRSDASIFVIWSSIILFAPDPRARAKERVSVAQEEGLREE